MKQIINSRMLVDTISNQCSLTQEDSERIMNVIFRIIRNEVIKGNKVRIIKFGVFDSVVRKSKYGMDIRRNKRVIIPAHRAVIFRASKIFKSKIK